MSTGSPGGAPRSEAQHVLITGGAGFIGSHLCERLMETGATVTVVDNFDPYYPREVKERNLQRYRGSSDFRLLESDIRDTEGLVAAIGDLARPPDVVVHLAALAGVRPSIEAPTRYSSVNVEGTTSVLEVARRVGCKRFVFGSSSSVYGNNGKVPFSESDPVNGPISPYAVSKRAGELMSSAYAHLYGVSVVALRFFTVYGPRQRPDLAIHKFARLIATNQPVPLYGAGNTARDYTFVSDIVAGVLSAIEYSGRAGGFEIFNLGGSQTTTLLSLVEQIGRALGISPQIDFRPAQPGDVEVTFADVSKARTVLGYSPRVSVAEGIPLFVEWFLKHRWGV